MRKIVLFLLPFVLCGSMLQAQSIESRGQYVTYEQVFDFSRLDSYQQIADRVNEENFGVPAWLVNILVNVKYQVKGYKVTYYTLGVNPADHESQTEPLVEATGLVVIPQNTYCELPTALYCHGTIFGDMNAPSNPIRGLAGGEDEYFKEDMIAVLGYAGHGYLTVAPDYVGYGDRTEGWEEDVLHPYLDARTEAAASIDLMRAADIIARELGYSPSREVFIAGHSQGGHAGMATLRTISQSTDPYIAEFRNDFSVVFAGLSSGPYDLSDIQFDFVFKDQGEPWPYDPDNPPASTGYPGEELTLMVLSGCQVTFCATDETFDFCNTDNVLTDDEDLRDLYEFYIVNQKPGGKEAIDAPWVKYFNPDYLTLLAQDEEVIELRTECLAKSDVFQWENKEDKEYAQTYNNTKTTFYYCETDERVSAQNSIKAKNAQRAQIPWWRFWLRWQINTFNCGNFDHFSCALPSLYFARVAFNQNRSYCPYWKTAAAPLPQETAGISVPSFLFFDAEIDFSQYRGRIVSVELLDANDEVLRQWEEKELQGDVLTVKRGDLQPGIYGLAFQDVTGKVAYSGIIVQDPELSVSDFYDPIAPNPMQRKATLDLSLLEEKVSKVSIYSTDGTLLRRIDSGLNDDFIKLERDNLPAGDYLVEVCTDRQSYFLPLNMLPVPPKGALVAPNPMQEKTWVDLSAISGIVRVIRLYTPEGRLLRTYTDISEVAEWFEIDRGNLPAGLYLLELDTSTGKKVVKLVVN